jgi:hypothetical protein
LLGGLIFGVGMVFAWSGSTAITVLGKFGLLTADIDIFFLHLKGHCR